MKTALISRNTIKFIFMLFLFFSKASFSKETDLRMAFNNYQKNYQSKNFEAAKVIIKEALDLYPNDNYLIYNLGLVEYKLGKIGSAIGLWRKALYLNPNLVEAQKALEYAAEHMSPRPLSKNIDSSWVWLKNIVINHFSFNLLWPLFLIFFFISSLQLINYFCARKKAFENDTEPPFFSATNIVFLVLSLFLGILGFIRLEDLLETKAIAISSSEIKTGPNIDFATLFEIPEGTEISIHDKDGEWYKIEDPTGRVGWISSDHAFKTTGSSL